MDFALSDEQRMLVESSHKLLARESPISRVREVADQDGRGYDERVWQRGAELGWAGLLVAEEYELQRQAYALSSVIEWPGLQYRRDIGYRAIAREA